MNRILSLLFLIIITILFSFIQSESSLDDIKAFKPGDKYFKANLVSLHFIIETSPISKIDTVFKQTVNQYHLPTNAKGCPDGLFFGESPYDAYDYKHVIQMEIKDGRIISADYNEVNINGSAKQEDSVYCEEMSVMGTTPAIAYPKMEKDLIDKQDMMKIDGVTGATYSLYRFRYATTVALMRARLAE